LAAVRIKGPDLDYCVRCNSTSFTEMVGLKRLGWAGLHPNYVKVVGQSVDPTAPQAHQRLDVKQSQYYVRIAETWKTSNVCKSSLQN